MSAKSNKLKLPTPEEYIQATLSLNEDNPDVFDFIEKIGDDARALPKDFLISLGLLARKAIPLEHERPHRLKVCRALAYGAALGVMIGERAHDRPGVMDECQGFGTVSFGADAGEEFVAEAHGVVDELEPMIGTSTVEWLRRRADGMAMTGGIDEGMQSWFVVGGAQSMGMLYSEAVRHNS